MQKGLQLRLNCSNDPQLGKGSKTPVTENVRDVRPVGSPTGPVPASPPTFRIPHLLPLYVVRVGVDFKPHIPVTAWPTLVCIAI